MSKSTTIKDFVWCCDALRKLTEYEKADLLAFSQGRLWLDTYWFSVSLIY